MEPVTDWVNDWDNNDPAWVNDPYPIWQELRQQCPMAHTDRYNEGVWLPLTYDQIEQIARDTETFTSKHYAFAAGGTDYSRAFMPPIHYDPPAHSAIRRPMLPFFGPRRLESWAPSIERHCNDLAAAIASRGEGDAAIDFAQELPVTMLALILGIPTGDADRFRHWVFQFLEIGSREPQQRRIAEAEIREYMGAQIDDRVSQPRDDLISHLLASEIDCEPVSKDMIERMLMLLLVAGFDTTWSMIGASLWHLATNPDDRRRLVAEPELLDTAIEEFLRAYAPAYLARRVTCDATIDGVEMQEGDTVMMSFPIACRDPEKFDRPDDVVIDREVNRHIAFGVGPHRCLGSNLARLEMRIALQTWLHHIPEFELAPGAEVVWSEGQVRGPRAIPIVIP